MLALKTLTPIIRATLPVGMVMILALARGQSPANGNPSAPGAISYSTVQFISSNDSPEVIAEKAAKVLPRENQIAWMRLERTFFIHFGPNTFNGVEWGSGREEPAVFNPTALDANQWMSAVKNAGGNLVVLVCKHHDGFCLWPTRYTAQSVVSSPWLGGKGDVVGAVAKAARAQGIKLGVYLSPADLYQLRTNPKNPAGYYGDGSSNLVSVIPTDPASFKTDPSKGRPPAAGFSTYKYEVNDYNRYFLNQLYELLTEYRPIAEVWFDGANPDRRVPETYDRRAWYDLIRKLQPGAVIAVKGPDVRWVGNESGVGRTTEWSVIPLSSPPETFTWPDMGGRDLGSRAKLTPGSYLWWYPAEVNTTIINGWFWAANKRAKSAQQLIDVFYQSVGRNGNMLLNLSPDKRGLVPENQLASLSRMAQVVNDTFATDLAAGGKLEADSSNPANGPALALDKNLDTWWEAAPGRTNATLTLTLPSAITFDVVSLQEAVEHRGQRIESVAIDTWNGTDWTSATELTTIGHRRIQRLSAPLTTAQVRIRITGSRLEPTLSEVGLFKQAVAVAAPLVSERDAKGLVSLSNTEGLKMVFTIDGTAPTTNSAVYSSPVSMPHGGTIQAASLTTQGRLGMVASKTFAGLSPIGWKVVAVDNQEAGPAANAIDGNAATLWQTVTNAAFPHFLTIDMGAESQIAGFTYLPRQDGSLEGVVETFRFESSVDGTTWTTNVASGRFGNIRNNPIQQEITFPPISARFFRFTALQEINGNSGTSAAEISVMPESLSKSSTTNAASQPLTSAPASRKLKNAPVPSAGCGKELGDFKSGTYTITSAGLNRQYTINIPENYDKNKPYRLIFAMHMMGGHMNTMVDNKFYGLKTYAERDKVPCIFVAPEGYTDRSPWRGRDDKDHIFFADMLALFKDKLSVDTSRIFCCGFSFGAMVTYSLSLDFQNELRAVACYAPANWNIYLPTNKHKPLAFFSTTGTEDGLCKWINSDARKEGGKYCVLAHLEDNGVKELPDIPIATTSTHVTTEFKGCPEEYPVLFGSFTGGHTDNARDPDSNANWISKETWDFFMRF